MNAGGATPKPGGGAGLALLSEGEAEGVDARGFCHDAGELRRTTLWRSGGDVTEVTFVSR